MVRDLCLNFAGRSYRWFDVDEVVRLHGMNLIEMLVEDVAEFFSIPPYRQVMCDTRGPIANLPDLKRLLSSAAPQLWLFDARHVASGILTQCSRRVAELVHGASEWEDDDDKAEEIHILLPWALAWDGQTSQQAPSTTSTSFPSERPMPQVSLPGFSVPSDFAREPVERSDAYFEPFPGGLHLEPVALQVPPLPGLRPGPGDRGPGLGLAGALYSGEAVIPAPEHGVWLGHADRGPSAGLASRLYSSEVPPQSHTPMRGNQPGHDDAGAGADYRRHMIEVTLTKPAGSAQVFGFTNRPDADSRGRSCLRVAEVVAGGLLAEWNMTHHAQRVHAGDCILAVNGVEGNLPQMRALLCGSSVVLRVERRCDEASNGPLPPSVGVAGAAESRPQNRPLTPREGGADARSQSRPCTPREGLDRREDSLSRRVRRAQEMLGSTAAPSAGPRRAASAERDPVSSGRCEHSYEFSKDFDANTGQEQIFQEIVRRDHSHVPVWTRPAPSAMPQRFTLVDAACSPITSTWGTLLQPGLEAAREPMADVVFSPISSPWAATLRVGSEFAESAQTLGATGDEARREELERLREAVELVVEKCAVDARCWALCEEQAASELEAQRWEIEELRQGHSSSQRQSLEVACEERVAAEQAAVARWKHAEEQAVLMSSVHRHEMEEMRARLRCEEVQISSARQARELSLLQELCECRSELAARDAASHREVQELQTHLRRAEQFQHDESAISRGRERKLQEGVSSLRNELRIARLLHEQDIQEKDSELAELLFSAALERPPSKSVRSAPPSARQEVASAARGSGHGGEGAVVESPPWKALPSTSVLMSEELLRGETGRRGQLSPLRPPLFDEAAAFHCNISQRSGITNSEHNVTLAPSNGRVVVTPRVELLTGSLASSATTPQDDELSEAVRRCLALAGEDLLKGKTLERSGNRSYKWGDKRIFLSMDQGDVKVRLGSGFVLLIDWLRTEASSII